MRRMRQRPAKFVRFGELRMVTTLKMEGPKMRCRGWAVSIMLLFATLAIAPPGRAQEPVKSPAATPVVTENLPQPKSNKLRSEHRFWDKENFWLFGGVGASRTLDYFSTLNMRRRGRQEIFLTNDVVDNHAAFAVIEAAATGVSIGASYLFHKYGHHKLERWTSFVHIGMATTGSVRNYCLKTAHTTPLSRQ